MYLLQPIGELYSRHLDWQLFRERRDDIAFYYRVDGVKVSPCCSRSFSVTWLSLNPA